MAIALRATSTGSNNNSAASTTISLPAGTTTGDITIIAVTHTQGTNAGTIGGSPATVVPPAGWSTITAAGGLGVFYRLWQSGDPSTVTFTTTGGSWWLSVAATYSGVDATTPIDTMAACYTYSVVNHPTLAWNPFIAPSVCPNYAGSLLLAIFGNTQSSGTTLPTPTGYTNRIKGTGGPVISIADKALTDGTPTAPSYIVSPVSLAVQSTYFGVSVALKASGAAATTRAAARPVITALANAQGAYSTSAGTALVVPLNYIDLRDGDMVAIHMIGSRTFSALPSGYTQQSSATGAALFTHTWRTGDTTAPSFTLAAGASAFVTYLLTVLRKQGVSANDVSFEQSGANTGTTTVASPSLTPINANDLFIVVNGEADQSGGTFSSTTAGLADDEIDGTGPSYVFGWLQGPASPTGAFSTTFSSAFAFAATASLFTVLAPAAAPRNFGYVIQ